MNETLAEDEISLGMYDAMDGPSEEEVYLAGIQCEHLSSYSVMTAFFPQVNTKLFCNSSGFFRTAKLQSV